MTMQHFTPMQYLKIDIASNFGLGKKSWDTRLTWFQDNQDNLDNLVEQAKDPALFYAGVQAFKKACNGEAIGYPISLDATASGAQLLSVLIGCEKSARYCNVVDTGDREDLYVNIYNDMLLVTGGSSKIEPEDCKSAIMTALYGSKAEPKRIFGEGEQLQHFYNTMEKQVPGIWAVNSALTNLWNKDALSHDWVMPDNYHVHVKVMDNQEHYIQFLDKPYAVHTKVNRPTDTGRSIGANSNHSVDGLVVREMGARCSYDPTRMVQSMEWCLDAMNHTHTAEPPFYSENDEMVRTLSDLYYKSGFLSARILEYIDIGSVVYAPLNALWDLLESLPEKPFELLTNHDCFRCLPNYGNSLRTQYNQILYEIAESNMLEFITSQIAGEEIEAPKMGLVSADVLEANYALS